MAPALDRGKEFQVRAVLEMPKEAAVVPEQNVICDETIVVAQGQNMDNILCHCREFEL
jgi:hypothetical protein